VFCDVRRRYGVTGKQNRATGIRDLSLKILAVACAAAVPALRPAPAEEDPRYIVYHDFIHDTPLELRLRFGPTGAFGWVKGDRMIVRGVAPGTPADGNLLMHDIITGVNGVAFPEGKDPRRALADGITESETHDSDGHLQLSVLREGQERSITLRLKVMGSYSEEWPFSCSKSRKILDEAAEYVAKWQHQNGYCGWFWNAFIFIAHPDLRYRDHARRAAYYMTDDLVEYDTAFGHPYDRGLTSWRYAYKIIFLSEYYLLTGDRSVLPALGKLSAWLTRGQMKCGSWGHRAPWGGYGAVNQIGVTCLTALLLAEECGIDVDDDALKRSVDFFGRFVRIGTVPYGDHPPFGYRENQGKCALSAIAFRLLGEHESSRIMGSMTCLSYDTFELTHAGGMFTWLWSPLGGEHAPQSEYRAMMEEVRWFFELGRGGDGAIFGQPTPENLSGRTWSGAGAAPRHGTGALAMVFALPHRRMRILGRDKAPTPDPATDAASKEDARLTLRDIESTVESGNIYLASEQIKALRRYRGDLDGVASLAARIPTEKLAEEKAAADHCMPNFKVRGWMHDLDTMDMMRKAAAMPDGYYSRFARKQLPLLIPSRANHLPKWQSVAADGSSPADALKMDAAGEASRLFRLRGEPLKELLALQLLAPEKSRVYLNGHPIVEVTRVKKKAGAMPSTVWLHPKVRQLLKKGENELVVRVPGAEAGGRAPMIADIVTADAHGERNGQ